METTETTETVNVVPVHYNPNQLVTYKVIDNANVTYPTVKVVDLEWDLENYRYKAKQYNEYYSRVTQLEERLADYLEMDSEEIVSDICSIFGFNPTKEIEFEATATIAGTVTVPLSELADFDINNVDLNVEINSWSHDINIDNVEVDDVRSL